MSASLYDPNCCKYDGSDKLPKTLSEKKKKYVPKNPNCKRLQHFKVDGCLIKTQTRCDYLMLNHTDSAAYFIELKGRALDKAAVQILCSIETLKSPIAGWTIHARIVLSKVPQPELNTTNVVSLKRMLKRFGGKLEYQSKKFEETL